uniref:Uncharacterized protein n=1 Tax=Mola mola TaxID=94237 RepID=A0A3Q3WQT2_MOLML
MPVETLRPSDGRLAGVAFTSAMPFRILNKGPDYFRRQAEPGARKLSAVERLEADKAKYVKSQQVALTRQAPIKPPIIRKPLVPPGMMLQCQISTPPARREGPGRRQGPALNLDILNNLINDVCDRSGPCSHTQGGCPASGRDEEAPKDPAAASDQAQTDCPGSSCTPPGPTSSEPTPPTSQHPLSNPAPTSSLCAPQSHRFFNYCGLDPEEVECMGGMEHFTRANSDIVSVSKLRSVSTPSSEAERAREDEGDEENEDGWAIANERVPYGISVIERNARVIKWLYGIRQARDANNAVSNV